MAYSKDADQFDNTLGISTFPSKTPQYSKTLQICPSNTSFASVITGVSTLRTAIQMGERFRNSTHLQQTSGEPAEVSEPLVGSDRVREPMRPTRL